LREYEAINEKVSRLAEEVSELKGKAKQYSVKASSLKRRVEELYRELRATIEDGMHKAYELAMGRAREGDVLDVNARIDALMSRLSTLVDSYVDARVCEAVANHKLLMLNEELKKLTSEAARAREEVEKARREAEEKSQMIRTERSPHEIVGEIKSVEGALKIYEDVDEEVEETYKYYKSLFEEVREKLEKHRRYRAELETQLKRRIEVWRRKITDLVDRVSREYSSLLSGVGARGYVRIVNIDDVERAGLEILVGFGEGEERVLDAYTQSGGERTLATMLFLLALQGYIKSPLRAVDEYEVHMDPRNREVVMNYLLDVVGRRGGQYIVITPGYISKSILDRGDVNIIVVQKTGDYSTALSLGEEGRYVVEEVGGVGR
jgi:chromosome segregation protein